MIGALYIYIYIFFFLQELYSSLEKAKQEPTPQKSVPLKIVPDLHIPTPHKSVAPTVDSNLQRGTPLKSSTSTSVAGFDEVVNMAEFFHRKTSHRSINCSGLSDPSLSLGKPRTFTEFLKDKDFQVSPFKPSVNDSAIKQKVQMVLSRLEDDSAIPLSNSENTAEPNALLQAPSRDSGFTDLQSDSGGSSEGAFTDVRNRGDRITSVKEGRTLRSMSDVNNAAGAQTVNEGEELHISFESNSSDEEIDVMTGDVQADGDDGDDDNDGGGGGHDDIKSATLKSKDFSVEQTGGITRTRKIEANMQEKPATTSSKDTPNQTGGVTKARKTEVDSQGKPETRRTNVSPTSRNVSEQQTGVVKRARKGEVNSQEKPETQGTNEMETSHSSMSSDKEHNQVRQDQYCADFRLFFKVHIIDPKNKSFNPL